MTKNPYVISKNILQIYFIFSLIIF